MTTNAQFLQLIKETVNLRTALIIFFCIGVGLGLTWLAAHDLEWWGGRTTLQAFCRDLGSVLTMTAALTLIWELFNKRAFLKEVNAKANLSFHLAAAGITHVTESFQDETIDWKEYFQQAKSLTIFAGYARTWRTNQLSKIKTFLGKNGQITVILPNPDNQQIIAELARRYSKTTQQLESLIRESADEFIKLRSKKRGKGKVTIKFVDATPQYSFYLFDQTAVLALYDHNPDDRAPVPTLICQDGNVLRFIKGDASYLSGIATEYNPV